MAQTFQYQQAFAKTTASVEKTSRILLDLPFDLARERYAQAVRIGFIEDSILAQAKFGQYLGTMEKLSLGLWARQV
jgi:hypothetical protein